MCYPSAGGGGRGRRIPAAHWLVKLWIPSWSRPRLKKKKKKVEQLRKTLDIDLCPSHTHVHNYLQENVCMPHMYMCVRTYMGGGINCILTYKKFKLGMTVYTYNLRTWEGEAGE